MKSKQIITIGREFGSGGKEIGKLVAEKLGIEFWDKKLIELAAQGSGIDKSLFEKLDEQRSYSITGGFMGQRNSFIEDVSYGYLLSNESLFNIQSDVIRELAAKGSALFVGRCADYVLERCTSCINIFITADREDKIERVSSRTALPPQKASLLIDKINKKRASYYNYFSNKKWGESSSYHLLINSSLLGIEGTSEIIVSFVEKFQLQRDSNIQKPL